MSSWRTLALAGAIGLLAAAGPAGAATIVLTQTPNAPVGGSGPPSYGGAFDLAPYLSDAQGRTFAITAATLSLAAHSDPSYGAPTTSDTYVFTGVDAANNQIDVLHTHTASYFDTIADRLTLNGATFVFDAQSVSGQVSQVLNTTQTVDAGTTDGPLNLGQIPGFPNINIPGVTEHMTNEDVTNLQAVYGPLSLSEVLNATLVQDINVAGFLNFLATPGAPGGGLPGFPGIPGLPGFIVPDGSQFDIDSVSLAFDLVQTGGPPPALAPVAGVPEPSAWALMLAGFGLAGAALRRRRDSLAVVT